MRLAKTLGLAALLILLGATVAYGLARAGLKELDDAARAQLGGLYLETPRGVLSYTREGPLDARPVILVHGFSTPKFVWEQVTPHLLDAGYQVITYDHLGRGFSDRPEGPYDAALYREELSALIEGLALATPVTLVGYSMGGANVVDYAATHPEQVAQLVLIAPAGYMRNKAGTSPLVAPVIGEWVMAVFGKQVTYAGIEEEVEAGRAPADMLDKFDRQAQYKGYTEALLSTLRHYPMADMAHRYKVVGATDIPVTAIWGTADRVVPYDGAAPMAADVPQLKLVTMEGANHNLTYGQADVVAKAMLKALANP